MENRVSDAHLIPAGCAACLTRRRFLGQSAIAAAAAAFLAACGDGQIGFSGVTSVPTALAVKVADFPGLATVNTLVNINGNVAAKRVDATTFVAFSRACTHQGFPVDLFHDGFFCSDHGSQFDNDGVVTVGPATTNLIRFTATYDAATDTLTIN